MYPISIGFIVDLLLSVSLTEPSLYESNTSSIFVSFLYMASNMLKKVEQKNSNVRKPLIHIFLTFVITSTRYVVLILFQQRMAPYHHWSNTFPFNDVVYSLLASSLNHLHPTGS